MTKAQIKKFKEFIRERDEAFLSLDEKCIRMMFKKYNHKDAPADPEVFWASVHKAITGDLNLPFEFRCASKAYLDAHGFMSFDDGEL